MMPLTQVTLEKMSLMLSIPESELTLHFFFYPASKQAVSVVKIKTFCDLTAFSPIQHKLTFVLFRCGYEGVL